MSFSLARLDEWKADYKAFFHDFMNIIQPLIKCCGYWFEWDTQALKAAHAAWVAECAEWESSRLMPGSDGLAELKVFAILMYHLAQVPWVKELSEFDFENSSDAREYEFAGTPEDCKATRADINAGRGAYLGYQFCMAHIQWCERNRTDKVQPFVFRMTDELEHNFLSYLLSEKRDPLPIYLFLEALFVRDDRE
jgi:hypothetical protein